MLVKTYLFKKAYAHEALSIDFNASLNDDPAYHSLSLDFLPPQSCIDIIGPCRGFLLLDSYKCLYLWNPSTRFNKQIPLSLMIIADNADNVHITFLYGFGYGMSSDDYRVVGGGGGSYNKKYMVSSSIDLEIFSLRGNQWEQIEFDSDLPYKNTASSNGGPRVGSFLNGYIHWLVYDNKTEMDVIIAFDLKEMTLSEIALPNGFYSDYSTRICDLMVFDRLISVWSMERSTLKDMGDARIRSTFILD
jgi:F-box interacting protein